MLDIGLPELLIILGVALIVLGPQRLPEIARSLGRAFSELRRTSEDLRRSVLLGEGFENETYHPPKTTAARAVPKESTHPKGPANSKETTPEEDIKEQGTSKTALLSSTDRGLDG